MSKKYGLLTVLTGVALGAAALFLSKKDNRAQAIKAVKKVEAAAKKAKTTVKKISKSSKKSKRK